jgi:hypothetical protein
MSRNSLREYFNESSKVNYQSAGMAFSWVESNFKAVTLMPASECALINP